MCKECKPKGAPNGLVGLGAKAAGGLAPTPAAPARRTKLWDLGEKYHCPVVGTCLSLDDLKKVARQAGYKPSTFEEYRLHVEAVSLSLGRNAAAEAMQRLLDRKFAIQLKAFVSAKTDTEVRDLWKRHLDLGDVAGGMWAAISHRHASEETRRIVYEDVHMLSHQVGAGQAADLRRLGTLEADNARLRDELRRETERHQRDLADKLTRIRTLEREAGEGQRHAEAAHPLRARIEALENGTAMIALGRRLLAAQSEADRARDLAARCEAMERELERLRQERDEVAAERDALERVWLSSRSPGRPKNDLAPSGGGPAHRAGPGAQLTPTDEARTCTGECDRCADRLAGRCVLCVGGRTPLLPQYRQLAERLGVRLIHHDGGREEALSRLPALLASSDAVICPTDCVGHLAYYQLKQHCKQAGKPCVLVKSSGVASFAAALARLAEGQADIQARD